MSELVIMQFLICGKCFQVSAKTYYHISWAGKLLILHRPQKTLGFGRHKCQLATARAHWPTRLTDLHSTWEWGNVCSRRWENGLGFIHCQRHSCPTDKRTCVNDTMEMLIKHSSACVQHRPWSERTCTYSSCFFLCSKTHNFTMSLFVHCGEEVIIEIKTCLDIVSQVHIERLFSVMYTQ